MLIEKRNRNQTRIINEINVVPYVDIMLVLLVIFMVVTPLAMQGLEINLPKTQADQIDLEQSQPFVIDVNENGLYFIEEDGNFVQVSLGFIEDRFSKIIITNPQIEIIVRGDQDTSYQSIAELLSVLNANGANNFSLATQP
ncbi:MAG: protein TolR [Halobacteriovoraceae bacterium]|nr:protein TolR [Halobacteriovoraceae bacterium]